MWSHEQLVLLTALGVAWLAIHATGLIVQSLFVKRLKRVHKDTWVGLGSPSPYWYWMSWKKTWWIQSYLFSGRYRRLGDTALNRLGTTILAFGTLLVLLTLILISVILPPDLASVVAVALVIVSVLLIVIRSIAYRRRG